MVGINCKHQHMGGLLLFYSHSACHFMGTSRSHCGGIAVLKDKALCRRLFVSPAAFVARDLENQRSWRGLLGVLNHCNWSNSEFAGEKNGCVFKWDPRGVFLERADQAWAWNPNVWIRLDHIFRQSHMGEICLGMFGIYRRISTIGDSSIKPWDVALRTWRDRIAFGFSEKESQHRIAKSSSTFRENNILNDQKC